MINSIKFFLKRIILTVNFLYEENFVSKKRKEKFRRDFYILLRKLEKTENFAFLRFSDGELFVLQNKKLIISKNYWSLDDKKYYANFSNDDKKEFLPSKHQFYRKKLFQSLKLKKKNYFKGISCSCCNGDVAVTFMSSIAKSDKNLTYSNLLQNGNYKLYITKMVNLFKKKKIILISNKNNDFKKLPFRIIKRFDVGVNCFINDYSILYKIINYIKKYKVKNHLFLFSASSLSNILIMELYKKFDTNTYIDVGSTLNPYFNFKTLSKSRSYLSEYWTNSKSSNHLKKRCYW